MNILENLITKIFKKIEQRIMVAQSKSYDTDSAPEGNKWKELAPLTKSIKRTKPLYFLTKKIWKLRETLKMRNGTKAKIYDSVTSMRLDISNTAKSKTGFRYPKVHLHGSGKIPQRSFLPDGTTVVEWLAKDTLLALKANIKSLLL